MATPRGARWVPTFAERHRIVSRSLTGNLRSPEKKLFIEKEVEFHLGEMARQLWSVMIDENDIENADETHLPSTWTMVGPWGFRGK